MKQQLLLVSLMLLKFSSYGGDGDMVDIQSITTKTESLVIKSEKATNLNDHKDAANALYALLLKYQNIDVDSNAFNLLLPAATCEVYGRYIRTIPRTSSNLVEFADSSQMTNIIFLLQTSLKLIDQTAIPTNVSINMSGMDPKQIQDPEARAEYERRIAENNQATQLYCNGTRLKRAVDSLKAAIKIVAKDPGGRQSVKVAVMTSQLPAKIKSEILN